MEDAVTGKMIDGLLPAGHDVKFSEIEAAFARLAHDRRRRRAPARALIATVIVVGPPERLIPAAEAIEHIGDVGVRAILISEGTQAEPVARVTDNAVAVSGLAPGYLNNAVAALRLSSLPAAVWWRGGSTAAFADLADLADRLIMDIDQPDDLWSAAVRLFDRTALTDLRWAALTRWRAALAHLFDLPNVRRTAATLKTVTIDAAEGPSGRLFAGWLRSSLPWPAGAAISIRVKHMQHASPLECVTLECDGPPITLKMREGRACFQATAGNSSESERIVPADEISLSSLIGEELGVRTRDLAFERALIEAREIPA
jgi:glucose-6-phosphate dehydrogenase-like protein OpcA